MDVTDHLKTPRQLSYVDYLKAAFNVRVHVKGLGGIPVNWLYLAAVAGVGAALPPVLLVGAAAEVALLTSLAGSRRFQRAIRARQHAERSVDTEVGTERMAASLTPEGRTRYEAFQHKCEEVLQIARRTGALDPGTLDAYNTNLAELREVYAKMLLLDETFRQYSAGWEKTDPQPEIEALEKALEADGLTDQMRSSRVATLEILRKRAESRAQIKARAQVVGSEIERLEQQIELFRDQAFLTRDPAVLSENMDVAAGMLEERNEWLQDNAMFVETLGQLTQTDQ
jgi:HAMP domain-containing protein